MNIYEIAKKANVSPSTVSRVLNNKPNISAETYAKVMNVLADTGYSPNAIARGLALNSMNMIGIVVDDIRNLYRAHVIYHLENLLSKNNYTTIVINANTKGNSLFSLIMQQQLDALIFVGSSFSTDEVRDFIQTRFSKKPVLLFNGSLDLPNTISVICDEYRGLQLICDHLYRTNKREFIYLNFGNHLASQRKLSGFLDKLADLNIPFSEDRIFQAVSEDFEGGCEAGQRIIESGLKFDAIVCALDLLAMGAIYILKQYGYSVPQDIAVTGFDNLIYGKLSAPFLTSVDGKIKELSVLAVERLMSILDGTSNNYETIRVTPTLFLGGTT